MQQEQERTPSLREALGEMKTFLVLWAGQLVSGLGSGLTGFALPVWIYERTGSVEQFGLLFFAALAPAILLSPVAGAMVDRWDRRRVLIWSDAGAALMTLCIAALVVTGTFEPWHFVLISLASASIGAFQDPAFTAATAMLVPREHYPRAIGMWQVVGSFTHIVTPLLAGVLVTQIGLRGVLMIDFATFLVAVGTLLFIRIPAPPRSDAGGPRRSILRDAAYGFTYIRTRPGLFWLLVSFAVINFWGGFITPLVQPLILAFSTPDRLGIVVSVAGVGSLLGGLLMGAWGGPKNRVLGIAAVAGWGGVCVALMGLRPSMALIALALFLFSLSAPILVGSSSAIWMGKTPPDVLGRVFAIRRMMAISTMPLAVLLAGPLAQRVFEPMLMPGGALAGSVGAVIGVGPGRGIGLMFIVLGALSLLTAVGMYLVPSIRNIERDLPDAAPPRPMQPPPPPEPSEPVPAAAGA
ncbi:MAG TPA: MFS transporter [Longimicrobium sp.]|nr:MFS transporter [Longimicrobium sp.]